MMMSEEQIAKAIDRAEALGAPSGARLVSTLELSAEYEHDLAEHMFWVGAAAAFRAVLDSLDPEELASLPRRV